MKKVILFLLLFSLIVLSVAGCKKANKEQETDTASITIDSKFANRDFGKATIKLIESGKNILACEDAKLIVNMIQNINKDFEKNPELSGDMSPDKMTDAMKQFEATMDIFGKELETKYADDKVKLEEIFQSVGEGFSNIFQVSVMTHLGIIDNAKQNEYIDVAFCGVAPKEGYVSPLEMDLENVEVPENNNLAPKEPSQNSNEKLEENKNTQDKK